MPLKYDQIAEVEAIVRRIVKEEITKDLSFKVEAFTKEIEKASPKLNAKKPESSTKASTDVPSDGGILVGKQTRK